MSSETELFFICSKRGCLFMKKLWLFFFWWNFGMLISLMVLSVISLLWISGFYFAQHPPLTHKCEHFWSCPGSSVEGVLDPTGPGCPSAGPFKCNVFISEVLISQQALLLLTCGLFAVQQTAINYAPSIQIFLFGTMIDHCITLCWLHAFQILLPIRRCIQRYLEKPSSSEWLSEFT